jgi:cytochrome c oxidase subunit II
VAERESEGVHTEPEVVAGGGSVEGESHPLAKMILVGVIAAVIGTAITLWIDWFPEDGNTAAEKIDSLYDVLLICSVPIFVLVMTIAIYCVVKFRAKPGDMRDGAPIHGNTRLEIIWVTIPFIMVSALSIYGWIVLDDIEAKQPDEMVVKVTGQQFTWTFEYPRERVTSPDLVLPRDQPVEFQIQTKDVIHSFWVPEFRLKSDAVPGITTRIRLTPNKNGEWQVVCAELCGLGHATMRQDVRVVDRGEFDRWVDEQRQAAGGGGGEAGGGGGEGGGAAADGEQIFTSAGCGGCHTLAAAGTDGTTGPDLDEALRGADAASVRASIVNPNAKIEKGFQEGVMPENFEQQLSPEELDALVEYLVESGGR